MLNMIGECEMAVWLQQLRRGGSRHVVRLSHGQRRARRGDGAAWLGRAEVERLKELLTVQNMSWTSGLRCIGQTVRVQLLLIH
jgi:hypothetical protein